MISIFTEKITPRVRYTFELVFRHILKVDFELIDKAVIFVSLENPKFSYARQAVENELFFFKNTLLTAENICPQPLHVYEYKELKAFFFHEKPNSVWPFDPFALSFYLSSRYEEYLSSSRDAHGRFPAKESLAYQHDFLQIPLVNLWAWRLAALLAEHFPSLKFSAPTYSFRPSYDIDHAWAFKHKGLKRTTGNVLKDVLQLKINRLSLRMAVLLGVKKDPFYTFDYLSDCFEKHQLSPLFFFLVGKYGPHDKNISIENKAFQNLIQKINKQSTIGIHPSYSSNSTINTLEKELSDLAKVTARTIRHSRQHYLKLRLPNTYRQLINNGITQDYTMGYAQETGFRAGLATPFPWYDLERETTTTLVLHPFQVMDVTLRNYLQLSPDDALARIQQLVTVTKEVNGNFISLWHNSSLSDYEGWGKWRRVHDEMLEICG